ncbi:hypothetical protein CgunFtcFv8_007723 [Champsocephalus gunnari]|uniref:Uncharacterized protein n=1 Tax=Champsocephalus gunnari TaxID=52237 RepID=A0AAN8CKA4_CHAGU|nr:hypothetical protein CgunFtcFv8_007723 [Champsocephalus gunnari]
MKPMDRLNTPGISDPWPPLRFTPLLPCHLRCLGHPLRPTSTHRPSCSRLRDSLHEGESQQHPVRKYLTPHRQ